MWKQLVTPRKTVLVRAGLCLKYARQVFGAPPVYRSAWHAWLKAPGRHPNELPPKGVAVVLWFSHWGSYQDGLGRYGTSIKDPMYGNWGHVVIQHADGVLWSSPARGYGFKRLSSISEVERTFNCKYVGWSEGINGVSVVAPDLPVVRRRQERIMNIVSYPHGGGKNVKRWYFGGSHYWLPIHVQETAELLKAQYGIEVDSYECANLDELAKFKRAAVGTALDSDDVAGM